MDSFLKSSAGWTWDFPGLAARIRERIRFRRLGAAWRDVVPLLQSPGWPGAARSLSRPLLPAFKGEQPLVSWALQCAPLVAYVGELKDGITEPQLEA